MIQTFNPPCSGIPVPPSTLSPHSHRPRVAGSVCPSTSGRARLGAACSSCATLSGSGGLLDAPLQYHCRDHRRARCRSLRQTSRRLARPWHATGRGSAVSRVDRARVPSARGCGTGETRRGSAGLWVSIVIPVTAHSPILKRINSPSSSWPGSIAFSLSSPLSLSSSSSSFSSSSLPSVEPTADVTSPCVSWS